jgi:hypothetical protein
MTYTIFILLLLIRFAFLGAACRRDEKAIASCVPPVMEPEIPAGALSARGGDGGRQWRRRQEEPFRSGTDRAGLRFSV